MAEPHRGRHSQACIAASGLLVLAALTGACGSSLTQPSAVPTAVPTPTPTPTPPPRVALISIDGLRPDVLTETQAPNILALAQRGAYTFAAQTVYPSTTLPGHASMLTGVEPSVHGITFDEYQDTFKFVDAHGVLAGPPRGQARRGGGGQGQVQAAERGWQRRQLHVRDARRRPTW